MKDAPFLCQFCDQRFPAETIRLHEETCQLNSLLLEQMEADPVPYRDARNVSLKVIKVEENDRIIWQDGDRLGDAVRVIKLSISLSDNIDRAAQLGKLVGSVEGQLRLVEHVRVECGDYPGKHPWLCENCNNWFGCLETHPICLGWDHE